MQNSFESHIDSSVIAEDSLDCYHFFLGSIARHLWILILVVLVACMIDEFYGIWSIDRNQIPGAPLSSKSCEIDGLLHRGQEPASSLRVYAK